MTGYVYKITNLINNKPYIGYTTKTPEQRWKQHLSVAKQKSSKDTNSLFKKAIRKYGADNFKVEVLEECHSIEELKRQEIFWIDYYNSFAFQEGGYGYNSTRGGDGTHGCNARAVNGYDIISGQQKYSYSSIAEAEQEQCRGIFESCSLKGEHTANGLVWFFAEEVQDLTQQEIIELIHCRFPTLVYKLDLETGKILGLYKNTTEAAYSTGSSQGNIIEACLGHRRLAAGYQWCYQRDIEERIGKPVKELPIRGMPISQYSLSGKLLREWPSLSEASKALKISDSHICQACNKTRKRAGGYQWRYADEEIAELTDIRKPKVRDLNTQIVYDSINQAAKAYNISHATANKIATGEPSVKYPNIKLEFFYEGEPSL